MLTQSKRSEALNPAAHLTLLHHTLLPAPRLPCPPLPYSPTSAGDQPHLQNGRRRCGPSPPEPQASLQLALPP